MPGQIEPGPGWGLDNRGGINTPGQPQGPASPPDQSNINVNIREKDRKSREQGVDERAADADEIGVDKNASAQDDENPTKAPDADDRPSV